jgi:hypothetical protein
MGYELYITRASSWLEKEEHPIRPEEWQAIVDTDSTLFVSQEDYYQRTGRDGQIEIFHPIFWTEDKDENCLWYIDGAIECKNPSRAWISKMVEIARRLHARVLGEGDEEYNQ